MLPSLTETEGERKTDRKRVRERVKCRESNQARGSCVKRDRQRARDITEKPIFKKKKAMHRYNILG